MATNYTRGAAFERKVAKDLEGYGYVAVRSAGSHSPADVIALKHGAVLCVQCKLDGYIPPDEWNELLEFSATARGTPLLARPNKQGRKTGIIYSRLTSRKDGRGRQPLAPWVPQRERESGEEVS